MEKGETELHGKVTHIQPYTLMLLKLQCTHKSLTDLAQIQILKSEVGPEILFVHQAPRLCTAAGLRTTFRVEKVCIASYISP